MNEKYKENQNSQRAVIILGASFGVAVGAAISSFTGNIALWTSAGICFGSAAGYFLVWLNGKQNR